MEEHIDIAVGDESIARLRARAERLDAAQHPGVVELLGFSESGGVGELRTVAVAGPTLDLAGPLGVEEVAGIAAAVATTLADLHERGVVHGAVAADQVLLAEGRYPVLCGLAPHTGELSPADDVAALGAVLGTLVDGGPLADLARWACEPDPQSRPTAAGLAAAITNRVPGSRLPGTPAATATDPHPSPSLADLLGRDKRRRPSRRHLVAGAGLVALVATALWVQLGADMTATAPKAEGAARAVTTLRQPAPTVTTERAPVRVWPPTSVGPAPTIARDGRTWEVGAPGDVVVVSRWGCAAEATAAVFRPETAEVWHYPGWAGAGQAIEGVPVQTVTGGRSATARDVDGDGCEELVIDRGDGDPVVVHPEGEA